MYGSMVLENKNLKGARLYLHGGSRLKKDQGRPQPLLLQMLTICGAPRFEPLITSTHHRNHSIYLPVPGLWQSICHDVDDLASGQKGVNGSSIGEQIVEKR